MSTSTIKNNSQNEKTELVICGECKNSQKDVSDKFCPKCGKEFITQINFQVYQKQSMEFHSLLNSIIETGKIIYNKFNRNPTKFTGIETTFKKSIISPPNHNATIFDYIKKIEAKNDYFTHSEVYIQHNSVSWITKQLTYPDQCIERKIEFHEKKMTGLDSLEELCKYERTIPLLNLCQVKNFVLDTHRISFGKLLFKIINNGLIHPCINIFYGAIKKQSYDSARSYYNTENTCPYKKKSDDDPLIIYLFEMENEDCAKFIKYTGNLEFEKEIKKNEKYQETLEKLIRQLPDVIYLDPIKPEFYTEWEMKNILGNLFNSLNTTKWSANNNGSLKTDFTEFQIFGKTIRIMTTNVINLMDVMKDHLKFKVVESFIKSKGTKASSDFDKIFK